MTMSLSAVAAPPDALVNNNLSLPGEITKSIMLDTDVSEIRGEVWPVILGVVAVDLALQAYFTVSTFPRPDEVSEPLTIILPP